ncbi:MAG: HNH endonuclease [Erysipelotrichales bacterium]|nr:HNH endonuclease [Erysipelotrichales bacterium]
MVAKILNKRSITTGEYKIYGKYDWTHKVKKYKSWNNILALAGLEKTNNKRNTTDEMLLEEILKIWILLERQPTTADIRNGVSIYSLNTYARHFGSWSNALKKFVEWINDDNVKHSSNVEQEEIIPSESLKHKTPREINLRLRYLVLKRDNFKCCICGSSPAKDPSVELHIDHIVPWSKGGETIIDNLQTLCSKCNLGKSNIDS